MFSTQWLVRYFRLLVLSQSWLIVKQSNQYDLGRWLVGSWSLLFSFYIFCKELASLFHYQNVGTPRSSRPCFFILRLMEHLASWECPLIFHYIPLSLTRWAHDILSSFLVEFHSSQYVPIENLLIDPQIQFDWQSAYRFLSIFLFLLWFLIDVIEFTPLICSKFWINWSTFRATISWSSTSSRVI